MRLALLTVAILSAAISLSGCRHQTRYRPDKPAVLGKWQPPPGGPDLAASGPNTAFGLKLLNELLRPEPSRNVVISPLGLGLALGMLYNGAGTTTRDGIASVLEVTGLPADEVNRQYRDLMQAALGADRKATLHIANAVWADDEFTFMPEFLSVTRDVYQAEARTLDLQAPSAIGTINQWASEQTEGTVKQAVTPEILDDQQILAILMDAVYFQGHWTTAFGSRATKDAEFTLPDGEKCSARLMNQEGEYRYLEDAALQAVSIPYQSGRLSLCVLLPRPDSSLAELRKGLTPERWAEIMARLSPRRGALSLPKLSIEQGIALDAPLKALGMGNAFSSARADFGPMCRGQLWLAVTRHASFLAIDETGTRAGAVTSLPGYGGMTGPPRDAFQMVIDRPFLFAIRDNQTGALLFLGVIQDPR